MTLTQLTDRLWTAVREGDDSAIIRAASAIPYTVRVGNVGGMHAFVIVEMDTRPIYTTGDEM